MELTETAVKQILKDSLEDFDAVDQQEGGMKDWRPIFEAAFQCLLGLKNTEAIQLFAVMCICALDFNTYSDLEDVLLSRDKTSYMQNTLYYQQLNKEADK